jgi:hypothetical protein
MILPGHCHGDTAVLGECFETVCGAEFMNGFSLRDS